MWNGKQSDESHKPSTTFPSESVLQAFMRLDELSAE